MAYYAARTHIRPRLFNERFLRVGDVPIERHLSAKDIRQALGISRARAYELIKDQPRVKFGASVRVAESGFELSLKRQTVRPAWAAAGLDPPIRLTRPRTLAAATKALEPGESLRIQPSRPRT